MGATWWQRARRDWGLKLFALALAVLIWTTVRDMIHRSGGGSAIGFGRTRTLADVPVWVLIPAREGQGCRVEPATVEVTVRGPRELVEGLQPEEIRVVVRVEPGQSGLEHLEPVEVQAPPGVNVVRVQPQRIRVLSPPD
ncbi:hypothetical protein [Limisphaera sp. VF-2]|jgi:YbbR domain-containing protein|uniref:hypothetical protein n=1 Tax=Limisphaera sp. VF-2 TaxID=3400418 RepID=UPI001773148E